MKTFEEWLEMKNITYDVSEAVQNDFMHQHGINAIKEVKDALLKMYEEEYVNTIGNNNGN